jgi:Rieske Fe-S protein
MSAERDPLWREELPIDAADERYVGRRQLAKFLVLTSLAMLTGNVWIFVKSLLAKRSKGTPLPPLEVAGVEDVPVGGVKVFSYPGPDDGCLLIRRAPAEWVAFSQKCTHLSCAVYYSKEANRIECPCHEGFFSAHDGRVLAGPPQRALPRILVERRGDRLVAVGISLEPEA